MNKWFVHTPSSAQTSAQSHVPSTVSGQIRGPFSADEIKKMLGSKTETEAGSFYLWARGLTEWIPSNKWNSQLVSKPVAMTTKKSTSPPQTQTQPSQSEVSSEAQFELKPSLKAVNTNINSAKQASSSALKPASAIPSKQISQQVKAKLTDPLSDSLEDQPTQITPPKSPSFTITPENQKTQLKEKNDKVYKVQYDFVKKGEMTTDELIRFTTDQENPEKVSVFDESDQLWKDIYSFKDIAKKFGISRRKHRRVPILAQFSGTNSRGDKIKARVITISVGGLGITDNFDLKLGDNIQGTLTSPHFFSPLTLSAEVTYSGQDGYAGLKFIQMNDEGHSIVTDYIKRFGKETDAI